MPEYRLDPPIPPPDTVIWRYLDLPRFLAFIGESSLYFRRVDKLADSYEGIPPASTFGPSGPCAPRDRHLWNEARGFGYVNCWSVAPEDHALLWQAYAGPQGVALRSTVGKLRSVLPWDAALGRVEYVDHSDPDLPPSPPPIACFLKRRNFAAEEELRAWLPFDPEGRFDLSLADLPDGRAVPIDIETFVDQIRLSPSMPEILRLALPRVIRGLGLRRLEIVESTLNAPPSLGPASG
jgi:hypothetical protein